MAQRVYYFRNFSMLSGFIPNIFYLISRACGRALIFNSVLILVLVLRNTITFMRRLGLGAILPLDHNIYVHKVTGTIIFFQAVAHSIAHLCNFWINIQPNPVKFVQLNYQYWADHYGKAFFNATVFRTVYKLPPGCSLVNSSNPEKDNCPEGSLPEDLLGPGTWDLLGPAALNASLWQCQKCDETVERGII